MLIHSLKSWFEIGGHELNIDVVIDPQIDCLRGSVAKPIVWLPQFGAMMGTLVFEGDVSKSYLPKAAREAGYTSSVMGALQHSIEFDVREFIEILEDWGWSHDEELRPAWLPNPKH